MIFPDPHEDPGHLARGVEKLMNAWAIQQQGLSLQELLNVLMVTLLRMRAMVVHAGLHEVAHSMIDYVEHLIDAGTTGTVDEGGNPIPFVTAEQREDPGYKQIEAMLAAGIPDFVPEGL